MSIFTQGVTPDFQPSCVKVLNSQPGFLNQWHTYWSELFELPLFTKEPVTFHGCNGDTGA